MPTTGERIKILRTESDLTQEEFGSLFGLSKYTISLYENDKNSPSDDVKRKIAQHFKVSLDWLMGVSDIRTPIETIAAHRTDDPTDELPEEARKSLEEFKDYILKKYGYKK